VFGGGQKLSQARICYLRCSAQTFVVYCAEAIDLRELSTLMVFLLDLYKFCGVHLEWPQWFAGAVFVKEP